MNTQKKHQQQSRNKNIKNPAATAAGPSINIIDNKFTLVFLFVFSFLLYVNTISHDYALDDVAVIQQNKFTQQGLKGIPQMLTTFYWRGYWDTNAGLYRPLSLITFAAEYRFFPGNPHIPHFINALLYATIILVLFIVFRDILKHKSQWLLLTAILLFLSHPVHTEVVANIKSRDELLCFLCFLISFRFLLRYIENKKTVQLILSLLFYFLSLLSKEGALAYLGIIPLILYFFCNKSLKETVRCVLPFGLVALLWFFLHSYVISHAENPKITYSYLDNTLVSAPDGVKRLATAIGMMGKYLWLLFFPHPLSYDYSFSEIKIISFSHPKALLSAIIYLFLGFVSWKGLKTKSIISFGILFYFITMAMVSNIFMLIGTTFADRLLFVPSWGFCLIAAFYFVKFFQIDPMQTLSPSSLIRLSPLLVVVSLYAFKTVTRNMDWKNNFTLFTKDVHAAPGSGRTHYNSGTEIMNQLAFKEKDEEKKKKFLLDAVEELKISVQIDPQAANSYLNLATAYYNLKDYKATKENAALSIRYDPRDVKAYSMLGRACYRLNEPALAIPNLLRTGRENYLEEETFTYLGASYFSIGKTDSALYYMNKARDINPSNKEIYINLGSVYGTLNQYEKSIENFKKAIALDSTNRQVYYFLALTYKNMGDTVNAGKYLRLSRQ